MYPGFNTEGFTGFETFHIAYQLILNPLILTSILHVAVYYHKPPYVQQYRYLFTDIIPLPLYHS